MNGYAVTHIALRVTNLRAALRCALAALIYWIIVLRRKITLLEGRALAGALLYGLLTVGASYAFIYWGLVHIQAGLASLILATTPLITHLLARAHGLEKYSWPKIAGALIALTGIWLAIGGGMGTAVPLPSLLSLLAGATCLAEGTVVYKLFPIGHPAPTNALALITSALLLAGLSAVTGEAWGLPTTPNTWAALIYLVLIGTVVSFYLFLFVLTRWTASATAYSLLLIPVATVLIAAWLIGEIITSRFLLGSAIVLAGVWLGAFSGLPGDVTSGDSPTSNNMTSQQSHE